MTTMKEMYPTDMVKGDKSVIYVPEMNGKLMPQCSITNVYKVRVKNCLMYIYHSNGITCIPQDWHLATFMVDVEKE